MSGSDCTTAAATTSSTALLNRRPIILSLPSLVVVLVVLADEIPHDTDGLVHRGRHRVGEAHPFIGVGRFAPHHQQAAHTTPQGAEQGQHGGGVHPVGVHDPDLGQAALALDGGNIGFDHIDGPGFASLRRGVDEDRSVVAVEQRIGEVYAPDPEVLHCDAHGNGFGEQPAGHFGPERVVAEEDVPDPRHQGSGAHEPTSRGSTSHGLKYR